jgi:hypothetical protein
MSNRYGKELILIRVGTPGASKIYSSKASARRNLHIGPHRLDRIIETGEPIMIDGEIYQLDYLEDGTCY